MAADELARLDIMLSRLAPGCTVAAWLSAVAHLFPGDNAFRPLVAAAADPIHDALLSPRQVAIRTFVAAEERRLRGGAALSVARWIELLPGLATYAERSRLEALWLAPARDRPVLVRAIGSAACLDLVASPGERIADLSAALLLCAAGRTAHLRFLPFARLDAATRAAATEAWRGGDEGPWTDLALGDIARSARRAREGYQVVEEAVRRDDATVDGMGRAAITARRALGVLRESLAVTVPVLAEQLELSRPAASDALERLEGAGVVAEVTGRARDRVFAWGAAIAAAEAPLAA